MLIFLDTEFTDFIDCELISIGMVSEDGAHIFYAERSDYRRDWANEFVKGTVLPYLYKRPEAICTRTELQARLWAWFTTLPRHVQIACDSQQDQDLLWDAFGEGLPANLDRKSYELAQLIDTTVFHKAICDYQAKHGGWHHALHDAQANRAGWLAWTDANMGERA
ncbi:3'-5' exoribonuclease [Andreprevotia chitinilytica]|uniref:3'-5' exoribonuclease n=1 Tax=Andreprevotia chitinilytica TaxID=396808 RepID=UPI000690FB71|nr:3'-5' exoribonuclease [Andreprevotia chitinilytica]